MNFELLYLLDLHIYFLNMLIVSKTQQTASYSVYTIDNKYQVIRKIRHLNINAT